MRSGFELSARDRRRSCCCTGSPARTSTSAGTSIGSRARAASWAPDLLGFGSSPRPDDSDYGPDAHVDALIQTLEALHVDGNVYVVTHSAGVLVGLRLAAKRPDWVKGLLAFGPPVYPSEASAHTRIAKLGPMVRFLAMDTVWAKVACKALYPFPGIAGRLASQIRPDLPPPIAEDGVKHSWASYSGPVRNLILSPQPRAKLDSLRIPIRWIAGAQDDVIDLEYLRELVRTHDSTELEVWSGGHDLPLSPTPLRPSPRSGSSPGYRTTCSRRSPFGSLGVSRLDRRSGGNPLFANLQ